MDPSLRKNMRISKFFIFCNLAEKRSTTQSLGGKVKFLRGKKKIRKIGYCFQTLSKDRGFLCAESPCFQLSALFSYLMAAYICAGLRIFVILHWGLLLPETRKGLRGAVCISHWINSILLYLVFPPGISNVYIFCSLSCTFSVQKLLDLPVCPGFLEVWWAWSLLWCLMQDWS